MDCSGNHICIILSQWFQIRMDAVGENEWLNSTRFSTSFIKQWNQEFLTLDWDHTPWFGMCVLAWCLEQSLFYFFFCPCLLIFFLFLTSSHLNSSSVHSGGFEIILFSIKKTIILVKYTGSNWSCLWSWLHHHSVLYQVNFCIKVNPDPSTLGYYIVLDICDKSAWSKCMTRFFPGISDNSCLYHLCGKTESERKLCWWSLMRQKNLLRRVFLRVKSVKTDQWTDTTVIAPVCD